ncbi:sensor histidine kinase [Luteimicrobium sp. NPDC057192]|uniref:sensor histidine kinase n=1 Tax=Luteimicrobium sp. NPDC057192 TaxID=3346042 RepID=UPI0036392524
MSHAAVAVAALVPLALGVLVVASGKQRRIGWLLVAHGVSVGLLLGGAGAGGTTTAGLVADQLLAGAWIFLFLWLVLIAYLLPDGRPPSVRWARWVRTGLAGAVLFLVGAAGDRQGFADEHDGAAPPLRWLPPPASDVLAVVGLVLVVLLLFGSVPAVRGRLRRAHGETRLQLLWLVWGSLAVPVGLLALWSNYFVLGRREWLTTATLTAVSVALPLAMAIAILRHTLFDIRLVLSRTLVYGALVVGVVGSYALLLYAAQQITGHPTAGGLLAVAFVAVAVRPAYSWLLLRIDRWVYGFRAQPDRALRLLAERAEAAPPDALGVAVTAAVAEALRVERVSVQDVAGTTDGDAVRVPLVHRGEHLADLVVVVPPGRRLSPGDHALLHDLARYAAVLVHSQRQAEELRESRSRIVAGREEERRRLRRDLHDGVGPVLAAVVLTLGAARRRSDAEERDALLVGARDDVREAISEVRRLVDDLRPPAIDEVGLLAAIRQRADALSADVAIEVSGPDVVPPLPAAVEVAAFRIASEAMANVVRHSAATRCRVDVRVDGAFELTVADNGPGSPRSAGDGVGWSSMRERAAELGGTCTIVSPADGGVVVRARLPLERRDPASGADERMGSP